MDEVATKTIERKLIYMKAASHLHKDDTWFWATSTHFVLEIEGKTTEPVLV